MKKIIGLLILSLSILSCKKETESVPLRCGTVFHQPDWTKNFLKDSLYDISSFIYVMYHSQLPTNQIADTLYDLTVPVRFLSNGTGILNGSQTFIYSIVRTDSYPEIHISGLNDISPVFPFINGFLNQPVLKIRVENFLKTSGQLAFTNGVQYPLTTQKYESCYLSFKRS